MPHRWPGRAATLAAAVALVLAPLTGCGREVSRAVEGPTTSGPRATAAGTSPRRPLPLGTARTTAGTAAGSRFSLDPRTQSRDVVQGYSFLTVVVAVRNAGAVAAAPPQGLRGSGWALVLPDGAVSAQDDVAARLTVPGFARSPLAPGAAGLQAVSLTLPRGDAARPLVLEHVDGRGRSTYWSLPAASAGPDLAAWRAALAPYERG